MVWYGNDSATVRRWSASNRVLVGQGRNTACYHPVLGGGWYNMAAGKHGARHPDCSSDWWVGLIGFRRIFVDRSKIREIFGPDQKWRSRCERQNQNPSYER